MSANLDKFNARFRVVPAVYVIFRDGDKVLLLKRANTNYFDGYYSLPAGHIDGGEPAIQAAIREAKEEVNADVDVSELELVHTLHRTSDIPAHHERIDLFFATTKLHSEIKNMEPEKCSELRWVTISDLPEEVIDEVRQVLACVAAGKPYSDFAFS